MLFYRVLIIVFVGVLSLGCVSGQNLTPEQNETVAALREDLERVRQEVDQASKEDALYSGGLVKVLIGVRLEILRTNAALIEQRIHAIEGGAKTNVVVSVSVDDPKRAAELAKDIQAQQEKVAQARREADRYSGGLVKALSESTYATATNTLAMLEQQYFVAKYGIPAPNPTEVSVRASTDQSATSQPVQGPAGNNEASKPKDCLKIDTFDSSVLSTNSVYTELAWKVDVANSCAETLAVRVTFTIYDKDEFELDSDHENIAVPPNGIGKARGKMLVSPPEKARRMARQGAALSLP